MLNDIHSPADVKKLSYDELSRLAAEIRRELTDAVSENGGHLSSNLGSVEMTIALHLAFDAPKDKLVFDVGHQAYAHKMLTGRASRMRTLRKLGGISGFPRIKESVYDVTNAGHASDAISTALGMARARDLSGDKNHVVAVVGDGALTGGLCYEALNDAGQSRTRLIIILNDNEMSISPNVGAMSDYLVKMRQSNFYRSFKQTVRRALKRVPRVGETLTRVLTRLRDSIKALFVSDMFFGSLDIEYLGPIDGHNIESMTNVFERAKSYDAPVVIHVVTQKGRGYGFAERQPQKYHGVGPFNKETGETFENARDSSGAIIARELIKRAESDGRITCVSAAMLSGTGLDAFGSRFPDRCFDVGIAEAHAVTMAAGMALGGKKPYVAIYSTFLQRAYDQIMMSACLNRANVTFLIDRAGLNGSDGETHQGVFDIGFLRQMPGLVLGAPCDAGELRRMIELSFENESPMAIRYPKTIANGEKADFDIGEWQTLREGADICILACGRMVKIALDSANALKDKGVEARVVNARFIKPMDDRALEKAARDFGRIITLEDGVVYGGFGEGVCARLAELNYVGKTLIIGVPDRFIEHATVSEQLSMCRMDSESVCERALEFIGRRF